MFKLIIKSWTVWGAIGLAVSRLAVDRSATGIAEAIAIVVTAIGARKAIEKGSGTSTSGSK